MCRILTILSSFIEIVCLLSVCGVIFKDKPLKAACTGGGAEKVVDLIIRPAALHYRPGISQ